jgi:hypothetical protein
MFTKVDPSCARKNSKRAVALKAERKSRDETVATIVSALLGTAAIS